MHLMCYRISVIFTVGAQKRVRLPNQVLLQRFALIIIIWLVMLTAWTTSQPPNVYAIKSEDGLKFYDCDFGPWGYAALGGKYQMYGIGNGPRREENLFANNKGTDSLRIRTV